MKRKGSLYVLAFTIGLLVTMILVPSMSSQANAADYAIPNGWFYTQAAGSSSLAQSGYAIIDDGKDTSGQTIKFWSEFKRLGGVAALGYPASNRFMWNGFLCQATQRVVLQWRPEINKVFFVNVMDLITEAGKDDYLLTARQTPKPADFGAEELGMSFQQIMAKRYKLLDVNPAIKAKFFSVPDPLNMNGLPVAPIKDMGNVYVLRAQRIIIQQWKIDVPWAKAGSVTVALGGDIAKETGLIAAQDALAVIPSPPAGLVANNPPIPTKTQVTIVNDQLKPAPSPTATAKQSATPLPPGNAQQCPNAQFVIPSNGTLGSVYMQPGSGESGFSDVHTGIDILGTTNDDVHAAYDGIVTYKSSYALQIWHASLGVETYYTHMGTINVSVGQQVSRGSVIGKKGSVGGNLVLLHFSIKKKGQDERYLANTFDPSTYLRANLNYQNGARELQKPVLGWCYPATP